MPGRYIRTNFRVRGGELDADAIGRAMRNLQDGSIITARFHGGFIRGSFKSDLATNVIIISAKGAMSEYYGATFVSTLLGEQSGFLVMPFVAWDASGEGASVLHRFICTVSTSGSLAFIFPLRNTALSAGSLLQASAISTSGLTVPCRWAGWIVSTP